MKRKLVSILLILMFTFLIPFAAYANNAVAPKFEPYCMDIFPSHLMYSQGDCAVYLGSYGDYSNYQFTGCIWECSRCYSKIVTEGYHMYMGVPIGRYVTLSPYDPIGSINFLWVNYGQIHRTSSNTLEGYTFC